MQSSNVVMLTGNLTRDPEIKTVGENKVAKFGLAVNRRVKNGDNWENKASFFDVETWRSASFVEDYLTKGNQVQILAEARQDTWEKDGQKFSKVVFIAEDVRSVGGKKESKPAAAATGDASPPTAGGDEVPF